MPTTRVIRAALELPTIRWTLRPDRDLLVIVADQRIPEGDLAWTAALAKIIESADHATVGSLLELASASPPERPHLSPEWTRGNAAG